MSSFDRRAALALITGSVLSACGFRPLYGGGENGPIALFGSVDVETSRGELPFRLREALVERLRPARGDAPLVLMAQTALARTGLAIEEDDEVTRYNLTLTVTYALRRPSLGLDAPALYEGQSSTTAAFNATSSQYATLVSEREVRARAAEDVADKIVKRLAAAYEPGWLA